MYNITQNTRYRPDIDGLRSISVLAVLFFHLGFSRFSGGFVGVDIFFVISGYLITKNIKDEFIATGQFDLKQFYIRRAKRILPAYYFVILFAFLFGAFLFPPAYFRDMATSALASMSFLSNLYFWMKTGYFDLSTIFKPLIHLWSLSVEEQYYIVWPLLLTFLLKRKKYILGCMVIFLISFGLNLMMPLVDHYFSFSTFILNKFIIEWPSSIYYLPFFRFFEFIIGSLILWIIDKDQIRKKYHNYLFVVGLCFIAYCILTYDKHTIFPSYNAILPCLGAALMILSNQAGMVSYVVKNKLSVWLGKRSYSLYLIHWPLIVYVTFYKQYLTVVDKTFLFFLFIALSDFMYRYIEQPFRKKELNLGKKNQFMARFFIVYFSCLVLFFSVRTNGWLWRIPTSRSQYALDYNELENQYCDKKKPDSLKSSIFTCVHDIGALNTIYIWGDSHARHLIAGFVKHYPKHNIAILYESSCMPQSGLYGYQYKYEGRMGLAQSCVNRNVRALNFFSHRKHDNIMIQSFHRIGDDKNSMLIASTQRLIQQLERRGHNVKLISDVIRPGKSILDCRMQPGIISEKQLSKRCVPDHKLSSMMIVEDLNFTHLFPNNFVNRDDFFTKHPVGQKMLEKPIFRDSHHLTTYGAIQFIECLKPYLGITRV